MLLALGLAGLVWQQRRWQRSDSLQEAATPSERARVAFDARAAWLAARERRADETFWARETLAQACGRTVDELWDALNAATNRLAVARSFPLEGIRLPRWGPPQRLPHGIERREPAGPGEPSSPVAWHRELDRQERTGWRLQQVEFRHLRFETDPTGQPRQSTFWFAAHLTNALRPLRADLGGDLVVDWRPPVAPDRPARVGWVDASRLVLQVRPGEPPFELIWNEELAPPERRFPIDPLLVRDLDGDGFAEIVLPSLNRVYRRGPSGGYVAGTLCAAPPGLLFTAILEDFDGAGGADLLCVDPAGLRLYSGLEAGGFSREPAVVWSAGSPLKNPMALTCGDLEGDGDLDVFLAQYRVPLLGQVLKPSYHDANDSDPAFLLVNDGRGRFQDATDAAGLGAHRTRRTYSASLVDLDADGPLDLVVVSDFAGAAVYRNDGNGRFHDVTAAWLGDAKGFGMAHTFTDFNADGRLDFLMIGMPSPTVDRLAHLGATRPGEAEDPVMRQRMACGNRLFLAQPGGGFSQAAPPAALTRTGWSWGVGAADFDNDGRPDAYLANGHQTARSVREYEPEFWLHDLYVDETVEDPVAGAYLFGKFQRTRGEGWSYGGYEKNRFVLAHGARGFLEVGHLFGVALEADSRNVVTEDLDGDGAPDLLVTTFELWPRERQTLQIYRNRLAAPGAWIGFEAPSPRGDGLPVGTRVTVTTPAGAAVRVVVNGDSHRSQHAPRVHFGLGADPTVDRAEIRWPDGRVTRLERPVAGRYHRVPRPEPVFPPAATAPAGTAGPGNPAHGEPAPPRTP